MEQLAIPAKKDLHFITISVWTNAQTTSSSLTENVLNVKPLLNVKNVIQTTSKNVLNAMNHSTFSERPVLTPAQTDTTTYQTSPVRNVSTDVKLVLTLLLVINVMSHLFFYIT